MLSIRTLTICTLTLAGATASVSVSAAAPQAYLTPAARGPHSVRLTRSVFIPMRDGVRLSTDLYFPENLAGKLPVILLRTAYDKGPQDERYAGIFSFFASHGYVVAIQDLRGKYESEGEFFAYSSGEAPDGYDTLSWLAAQPWSNGRIGTFGCSYDGEVQHMLATQRHPAHAAAIIQGDAAYKGNDSVAGLGFRSNGAVELAAALSWNIREGAKVYYGPPPGVDRQQWFQGGHAQLYSVRYKLPEYATGELLRSLPVMSMAERAGAPPNHFREWVVEQPASAYWDRQGGFTDQDRFAVPALHMSSWYDLNFSARKAFELYQANATTATAREHQYLILSPGDHCAFESLGEHAVVGGRDLGDARYDYYRLYLEWFDHWLKSISNGVTRRPKVQFFMMGEGGWRTASTWPPVPTTPTKLYLHSAGRAQSRRGDGTLRHSPPPGSSQPDTFVYDPEYPTPTRGSTICCTGTIDAPAGAADVADIELRTDTLVYTTEPLTQPLEIIGEVSVDLRVSSDAPDTDIVARLTEVDEQGRSFVLVDGIMRMRYSAGRDRQIRLEPAKVYPVTLNLGATAIRVAQGHRLRLDIASAGWPRWDRNLNTGGANYDETTGRIARNTIHHDAAYPSSVTLPVVATDPKR